jgi:hypothetical protein
LICALQEQILPVTPFTTSQRDDMCTVVFSSYLQSNRSPVKEPLPRRLTGSSRRDVLQHPHQARLDEAHQRPTDVSPELITVLRKAQVALSTVVTLCRGFISLSVSDRSSQQCAAHDSTHHQYIYASSLKVVGDRLRTCSAWGSGSQEHLLAIEMLRRGGQCYNWSRPCYK